MLEHDSRFGRGPTHTGFSVRIGAELGFAGARRSLSAGAQKLTGFDAGVSLDIGATVVENLVVYGRAGGLGLNHAADSDSPRVGSAFFGFIGPGARYYFMPLNWYAGATLGIAAVGVTNDVVTSQNAKPGYAFQLDTGKDWWAAAERDKRMYGLGLRFSYARSGSITTGGQRGKPWAGTALSLVFSTGYN
jgi:hypothetical protein